MEKKLLVVENASTTVAISEESEPARSNATRRGTDLSRKDISLVL